MRTSRSDGAAGAEGRAALGRRARRIADVLAKEYPDAGCALDHRGPFELLVATILAAQCTDERVNQVTPALFARFPDATSLAAADPAELESLVRSTGFFRAKARSLRGAAETLASRFADGFPSRMDDLLTLPGVGRKTANVVLGTCFGQPAIIVDTHVRRVSQRLGLASTDDPDEIERQLQDLLPADGWTDFSHRLTFHGRRRCHARKPDCGQCVVAGLCPSHVV
ncbi:MAG: endonuclease III [Spirochaetes bacterium]|nr:endonuclease III [Spirochaetota bacterium]